MKKRIKRVRAILSIFVMALFMLSGLVVPFADTSADTNTDKLGFSMSPLKENVILSPGETYKSSFTIHNPATSEKDFAYEVSVTPFFVDENYRNVFEKEGAYNEIVDWITIDSPKNGTLTPNEKVEINFTINVPKNAPGGGQYAAISVTSANPTNEGDKSAILERAAIAHTIFAEVTGNTIHSGEVKDATVPSFITSGNIYGESTIVNTGNVHGKATYTLTVNSLFSNEEIYSNSESPASHDVLPGRAYYSKTEWDKTPSVGMFNVRYVVDFDGVVTEVSKMVIICPIWLMVVLILVVVGIIVGIVVLIRKRK